MKPHGLTVEKPHHLPGDHHGPVACQNCGHVFSGKYCPECSQRADTHRINWHYIWHEVPHSIWHVDKGILYTMRELTLRPGHSIRAYLAGQRVQHYRPLAYLILASAVLGILLSFTDLEDFVKQTNPNTGETSAEAHRFGVEASLSFIKNQKLFMILSTPLFAFGMWLFLPRRRYNFPEHLTIYTFLNAHMIWLMVLTTIPILLGYYQVGKWASLIGTVGVIGYLCWAYAQLYQPHTAWKIALRTLAGYVVTALSMLLMVFLVVVVLVFTVPSFRERFKPAPAKTTTTSSPARPAAR